MLTESQDNFYMFDLPDSPRSLGDLVGLGFRLIRKNWKFVISIFLVPSLIFSLAMAGVEFCFVHWAGAQSMDVNWFVIHMAAGFALAIIMIACQWEIALRSCAYIRCVLNSEIAYEDCYAYARRRQWPVLVVYGVSFLFPVLVLVVWMVLFLLTINLGKFGLIGKVLSIFFGFLEGLSFVAAFSFTMLYTALCFVSISEAEVSAREALSNGYQLSISALPRGLSYVCLLAASIFILTLPLYMPVILLGIWEGYVQGRMEDIQFPLYLRALEAASSCAINIISLGVALSGVTFYFRDVKMRRQGLDILEAMKR